MEPHRGTVDEWLDRGCDWPEGRRGETTPLTQIKNVKRSKPPSLPRGIERASAEAQRRRQEDHYAMPVCHYETNVLIQGRNGRRRRPSVNELELLHGYVVDHITAACRSSEAKVELLKEAFLRRPFIADGLRVRCVAWLLGHPAYSWGFLAAVLIAKQIRASDFSREGT